ncbi:hypothetical protein [Ruminiclostridium josui]|uniref:hypothetical protein n=1 Tax=Ruminiclostridium josui TaxID=1499 RepID=UPI0004BA3DB8|nr:hypothetical protein [Ruminiclostridium josui]
MNYYERIQKSIDYIEENLENKIILDFAAQKAYMSMSNFYRMFFALTGYTVKEYIRFRRISLAAFELRRNNTCLIDIAIKFDFESGDSIQNCGRPMVLSLSPGPALINKAWHYEKYANMWRITDDFWDSWPLLKNMFERCEIWQNHVSEGCYPDCDMLPLGYVGKGFGEERLTNFTREEQITMMTLWCIFRSPLMVGAELTKLDKWTLELITNRKVLRLLTHSTGAKQISRDDKHAIWFSRDTEKEVCYLALFNLSDEVAGLAITPGELGFECFKEYVFEELWCKDSINNVEEVLEVTIEPHGAKLFEVSRNILYNDK